MRNLLRVYYPGHEGDSGGLELLALITPLSRGGGNEAQSDLMRLPGSQNRKPSVLSSMLGQAIGF